MNPAPASDWAILLADFGEPFVITGGSSIAVLLDIPTDEASLGTSHIKGLLDNPQALAVDADLAAAGITEGSFGALRGKTWHVARIEPTGDGVSNLTLVERQAPEDPEALRRWR